jgi:hypothetical protein
MLQLNGTLVLVARAGRSFVVVAYLTITDQQSVTRLIKVDENGRIDMKFHTPIRPNRIDASILDDHEFQGPMRLEKETLSVLACQITDL